MIVGRDLCRLQVAARLSVGRSRAHEIADATKGCLCGGDHFIRRFLTELLFCFLILRESNLIVIIELRQLLIDCLLLFYCVESCECGDSRIIIVIYAIVIVDVSPTLGFLQRVGTLLAQKLVRVLLSAQILIFILNVLYDGIIFLLCHLPGLFQHTKHPRDTFLLEDFLLGEVSLSHLLAVFQQPFFKVFLHLHPVLSLFLRALQFQPVPFFRPHAIERLLLLDVPYLLLEEVLIQQTLVLIGHGICLVVILLAKRFLPP